MRSINVFSTCLLSVSISAVVDSFITTCVAGVMSMMKTHTVMTFLVYRTQTLIMLTHSCYWSCPEPFESSLHYFSKINLHNLFPDLQSGSLSGDFPKKFCMYITFLQRYLSVLSSLFIHNSIGYKLRTTLSILSLLPFASNQISSSALRTAVSSFTVLSFIRVCNHYKWIS